MAFDLNKNDGSKKEPSKFDLSKGEIEKTASASRNWLIGLFGILVLGGGIWYYSSVKTDTGTKTSIQNVSSDPASVAAPVEPTKKEVSGMDTSTAADSTKVKAEEIAKNNPDTATPGKLQTAAFKALNHAVPVTFFQGSSSFASTNKVLIKRIVAYLTQNPSASIHIDGYASSDGPIAVNQQISQARADAFKNHLTSLNVETSRITATGKGIENPVASNKTALGRKKNRRVEIMFL
ncbi:OmpA family protein [Pedobacter sp. UBA5917]|jgi:outer membrane protein OmpA-like peptidoglycan-associated protein|uniref:OmpA family protein n=1 Tax=Pedobacter sp. UBA5917 TaxID=1947061 RepID=UPI0025EA1A55|nr:OmpA family protein [Pedobacter sp. UBA5917]